MPATTARKKMNVVRFYLQGDSYQQMADKAGVAKGTVVNIIRDLKEGRIDAIGNLSDEIDAFREIAVDLKRSGLTVSQATIGISAFQGISSLGIPPNEVKDVVDKCRQLTPDGIKTQAFLAAAVAVRELEERTGYEPQELEEWVTELERQCIRLEQRCRELAPMAKKVAELTDDLERLTQEQVTLESEVQEERGRLDAQIMHRTDRLERLEPQVVETERLIGRLGQRLLDQEELVRQASARLDRASPLERGAPTTSR